MLSYDSCWSTHWSSSWFVKTASSKKTPIKWLQREKFSNPCISIVINDYQLYSSKIREYSNIIRLVLWPSWSKAPGRGPGLSGGASSNLAGIIIFCMVNYYTGLLGKPIYHDSSVSNWLFFQSLMVCSVFSHGSNRSILFYFISFFFSFIHCQKDNEKFRQITLEHGC